jgi:hypothetical protein
MKINLIDLELNREFNYQGTKEELEQSLTSFKELNIENVSKKSYKLRPHFSLGTIRVKGLPGLIDGINVVFTINEIEKEKQHIRFTTNIRFEHFFIAIVFIVIITGILFSEESKWLVLYSTGLWLVFHLWFHWILRVQENLVVEKTVKRLRLRKLS